MLKKSDTNRAILVTGADGFVGRHLVTELQRRGRPFVCATRRAGILCGQATIGVGDLGPDTDWFKALENCFTVVHLAGRAHVLNERNNDPAAAFNKVNAKATKALVDQAARHGVQRLLFASTIAVFNPAHIHLDASTPTAPSSDYGRSKLLAEQFVRDAQSVMAHTILRVPLVYGPGVSARFLQLLRLADLPFPLPFGALKNIRSLIYVQNLVDLILKALGHSQAKNRTFLVSDNRDMSTAFLLRQLATGMGRPGWLWPAPQAILEAGAALVGKRDLWQKFAGDLTLDCDPVREQLGWVPPFSPEAGLKETATWFANSNSAGTE